MLLRRRALDRIGGIASIRGALIDDVALAAAVKRGGRIWLGHSSTCRAACGPYPGAADIWRMVARTAYVQLRHSPLDPGWHRRRACAGLAGPTGHGAVRPHGPARGMARAGLGRVRRIVTCRPCAGSGLSPACGRLALPGIACFYLAATLGSAWDHHCGRGTVWKRRAYGVQI